MCTLLVSIGRQKRIHLQEFPIFTPQKWKVVVPQGFNSAGNFHGWWTGASCASQSAGDSGHERAWNFGEKKEDDEGILFYLLRRRCIVAVGISPRRMLRRWSVPARPWWRRSVSLASSWNQRWASTGTCRMGSGTAGRVRCRVGVVGSATQREDDGDGKKRADGERRRHAYFDAQENPVCQLLGDGELG